MNKIDEELTLLRNRIAALEEKRRKEQENKINPMSKLESVIDEKKKNHRYPGPGSHRDRFVTYNMLSGELAYLEPIFYILQEIQGRLTLLESDKDSSGFPSNVKDTHVTSNDEEVQRTLRLSRDDLRQE